jgi:hypothetical protein
VIQKAYQENITIPTPTKPNNLVKPDFSPLLIKQNQFGFKQYGSYKKPKFMEPESTMTPIKSPNFKTSAKMEGRNLFGAPQNQDLNNCNFFKKLNFDDCCDEKNSFLGRKNNDNVKDFFQKNNKLNMFLEKCDEEDEDNFNLNVNDENKNINDNLNFLPSPKFGNESSDKFMFPNNNEKREKRTRSIRKCSINIESNIEILKNGKFENEFNSLKTIKIDKFSTIYKVEEIKTKKIFCIKKIVKTSPKSNIDNLKKITYDFKNNNNSILNQFCAKILEFWIEKEEFNVLLSELNYCDKNLYLLSNFYENGDIFDFLEKLELLAKDGLFEFTESFYWDIFFEMMMGVLFVHECGYMHIDIQPANFLVDENGYMKLSDFSLALRVSELCVLDDIVEGDSRYISKELFHFKKNTKINSKVDVFSLGLSILEIIAKIELPYNGNLWHELRNEFKISKQFFDKSNIKNVDEFISLITQMILPFDKRPTIKDLISNFPQLSQRYKLLLNGNYKKSCKIPKFKNNCSKQLSLSSAPSHEKL